MTGLAAPPALDTVVLGRGVRLDAHGGEAFDIEVFPGEVFVVASRLRSERRDVVEACAGFLCPHAGSLMVCGAAETAIRRLPPTVLGVALDDVAFERRVRVAEALALAAGPARARVDAALDLMALAGCRDDAVDALPASAAQRVVLAIALLHDPLLLVADEPTRRLESEDARRFWSVVLDRRRRGRTSFIATSRLAEAELHADRVAVVAGRRLVALDSPARLVAASRPLVTITFELPPAAIPLAALEQIETTVDASAAAGTYTLRAADGVAATRALFRLFDQLGLTPSSFLLRQPTLEDVVWQLTAGDASP